MSEQRPVPQGINVTPEEYQEKKRWVKELRIKALMKERNMSREQAEEEYKLLPI